ncbi:hypothetical protein C4579_01830 [Candidatus Microgenomates bacterium]|nr:MAG: hypothetical protein C4579_01830 [Candidatus Microgenomates bacterium]
MDVVSTTHNFYQELVKAESGKKTSLPFIRHQLALKPLIGKNEQFEVLRIGGSIYQKAIVQKRISTLTINSKMQAKLPKLQTASDLFTFFERYFDQNTQNIALNFAYPMKPVLRDERLDGTLIAGTKEHSFKGLVGKNVGESIEKYVYNKFKKKIAVSVANDTVCLLLSGLIKYPWETIVGGVVGTGVNFALFLDEHTVVNLESANFDKFTASDEGKEIDRTSNSKKTALFEKESSGGYLYQHFNLLTKKLGLKREPIESTLDLDAIAKNGDPATPLARRLFEYSASMIACQMAGITMFHKRDLTFVMEGSLFWDGWKYRDNVDKYLKMLVPQYKIRFRFMEDSGVLGAAKLIA